MPAAAERASYVPNIRKCIGVGGLYEPQARNIIFIDILAIISFVNAQQNSNTI